MLAFRAAWGLSYYLKCSRVHPGQWEENAMAGKQENSRQTIRERLMDIVCVLIVGLVAFAALYFISKPALAREMSAMTDRAAHSASGNAARR